MDAIETIQLDGWTAEVFQDTDADSPASWCNVGTLAYDTRGASVGDLPNDPYGSGRFTDYCFMCDGEGTMPVETPRGDASLYAGSTCPACSGSGYVTDGHAIAKRLHDSILTLPVYATDYGAGTSLRVADSWEEANGWIFTTGKCSCGCGSSLADSAGVIDLEALRLNMVAEIGTWTQWAQGDVYGYSVTSPAGAEVDSCGGFYGLEYAVEEADSALRHAIEHDRLEDAKIRRMMAI